MDHHVTPTPERVAIPMCRLQSKIVKEEVTNILITGSLSSEQDQEENSLAHVTEGELEEATIPSCEIREYLSLLEASLRNMLQFRTMQILKMLFKKHHNRNPQTQVL